MVDAKIAQGRISNLREYEEKIVNTALEAIDTEEVRNIGLIIENSEFSDELSSINNDHLGDLIDYVIGYQDKERTAHTLDHMTAHVLWEAKELKDAFPGTATEALFLAAWSLRDKAVEIMRHQKAAEAFLSAECCCFQEDEGTAF